MGQVAENVKSIYTESFEATEDISDEQWYGMKMTASGEVTRCTADTDKPVGILTNKPSADGRPAQVLVIGRCPIVAGEDSIDYDDLIRIDSDGKAAIFTPGTHTTYYCIGRCIKGGDDGEKIIVMVNCATPVKGDAITAE